MSQKVYFLLNAQKNATKETSIPDDPHLCEEDRIWYKLNNCSVVWKLVSNDLSLKDSGEDPQSLITFIKSLTLVSCWDFKFDFDFQRFLHSEYPKSSILFENIIEFIYKRDFADVALHLTNDPFGPTDLDCLIKQFRFACEKGKYSLFETPRLRLFGRIKSILSNPLERGFNVLDYHAAFENCLNQENFGLAKQFPGILVEQGNQEYTFTYSIRLGNNQGVGVIDIPFEKELVYKFMMSLINH